MNIPIKVANELLFIINQFPISLKEQIDTYIIEGLNSMYNEEIYSHYDSDKPFTKQQFEEDTLKILDALVSRIQFK